MKAADLSVPIETPEGSVLVLRPAGLPVRAAAWLMDAVIRLLVYSLIGMGIGFLGGLGVGLYMLLLFAGEWLYFALYEGFRSGATPGKRRMGIRVVQQDGGPVGLEAALVRNLVRAVDALPIGYGAGIASCLFSDKFQRLGDRVAGTLVVHAEQDYVTSDDTRHERRLQRRFERMKERRLKTKKQPEKPPEPKRPAEPLTGREAALILAFEERRTRLHPARQVELANLLTPMTGAEGEAAVKLLRSNAAWLEGEA